MAGACGELHPASSSVILETTFQTPRFWLAVEKRFQTSRLGFGHLHKAKKLSETTAKHPGTMLDRARHRLSDLRRTHACSIFALLFVCCQDGVATAL